MSDKETAQKLIEDYFRDKARIRKMKQRWLPPKKKTSTKSK